MVWAMPLCVQFIPFSRIYRLIYIIAVKPFILSPELAATYVSGQVRSQETVDRIQGSLQPAFI